MCLVFTGLALAAAIAVIAVWVVHLDGVVTREFQGRHWSVPARVFAAPLELYVGAPVSAGDPSTGPGIYLRHGDSFDVQARRVRFSDELREPTRLSIRASGGAITDL